MSTERHDWLPVDDKFLRRAYVTERTEIKDIAAALNKTRGEVRYRISQLRLRQRTRGELQEAGCADQAVAFRKEDDKFRAAMLAAVASEDATETLPSSPAPYRSDSDLHHGLAVHPIQHGLLKRRSLTET